MNVLHLRFWPLLSLSLLTGLPSWGQDGASPEVAAAGSGDISIVYGSAFAGSDGSIFGSSNKTGFDVTNKAAIALGYFDSGFDVATNANAQDLTSLLAAFNVLHTSNFDGVAAPGFLATGGTVPAGGLDETPYIFLASGITDFSNAATATEYGLFTDTGFGTIPDGGSPVPSNWAIDTLTYDTILLGSEEAGGGFGNANAYLTQTVTNSGGGGDPEPGVAVLVENAEEDPQISSTVADGHQVVQSSVAPQGEKAFHLMHTSTDQSDQIVQLNATITPTASSILYFETHFLDSTTTLLYDHSTNLTQPNLT